MSRKDDFNLPSDRKGGGGRKFEQKNINNPKPKPTPKKENKVLKFLNEKYVKPTVDTAVKYIVQPIVKGAEVINNTIVQPVVNAFEQKNINNPTPNPTPKPTPKKYVKPTVDTVVKYIVQPIVRGAEVINDTIVQPVVNAIDNSISKNNEQHEKNEENSKKNQEAIKNYIKNEKSREYYHETIKRGTEEVLDFNVRNVKIGINNFFVSLADYKQRLIANTYNTLEDPEGNPHYAFSAYDDDVYSPYATGTEQKNNENVFIKPASEKELNYYSDLLIEAQKGYEVKVAFGKELRTQRQTQLMNIEAYRNDAAFRTSVDFFSGFTEQVSNPIELAKNYGFNLLTPGSGALSLGAEIGINVVDNLLTNKKEIERYEGREMTQDEITMSILTGTFMPLAGRGLKALTGSGGRTKAELMTQDAVLGKLSSPDTPTVNAFDMHRMFELDQDLRTTEGFFQIRNFNEKVWNQKITPDNYDIKADPVYKMTVPSDRIEILDSSKVKNPQAPLFTKRLEAIPDEYKPVDKLGRELLGSAREKQFYVDNITTPFEQNYVKSIENTAKALNVDYKKATANTLPGQDVIKKTDINTSEMTKKITQDMIVAPYENTYKRNLLAEKSLIDTLTDNRFSSVEEFVGFLNNHDDTYLSKMYINADDGLPEYRGLDLNRVREYIGIRKNANDKLTQMSKRWQIGLTEDMYSDMNVHDVISKYPETFESGGIMKPNQMVKHALLGLEDIEGIDKKLMLTYFDDITMRTEVENVIRKGLDENFDIENLDIETLNYIKDIENKLESGGTLQVYDFDKQEFISVRNRENGQFKLSEIVENYMEGMKKIDNGERAYIKTAEGELIKNRKYKSKVFKLLTDENMENARLESVTNKNFILRDFDLFNKAEELTEIDLQGKIDTVDIFKNPEQKFEFQNRIEPLIDEFFELPENLTTLEKAGIYREFLIDVKATTRAAHMQGEIMEFGNLIGKYFGGDTNRFKNYLSGGEGFLKTNEQFYNGLVVRNKSLEAQFETYGMPAYAFRSRIQFGIANNVELWKGVDNNTAYRDTFNQLKQDSLNALDNYVIKSTGTKVVSNNTFDTAQKRLVSLLSRSILAFRGIYEPTTNSILANRRAMKYAPSAMQSSLKWKIQADNFISIPRGVVQIAGSGADYLGNAVRQMPKLERIGLKMMKLGEDILTEGKTRKFKAWESGLMIEALDEVTLKPKTGNFANDAWAWLGDILMRGDRSSDQINRAFKSVSLANANIRDGLKFDDFNKINNNIKQVLKTIGVDEVNYPEFQGYVKEYYKNRNMINPNELMELSLTDRNARKLLNVYDSLYFDNQTINKANLYSAPGVKNSIYSNVERMNTLFKRFAIAVSSDDMKGIMDYTNKEGVYRSRWTSLEGLGNTALYTIAPIGGLFPTLIAISASNGTYKFVRDLISGKKDAYKTLSLKMGTILNDTRKIFNPENEQERWLTLGKNLGGWFIDPFIDGYNTLTSATDITSLFKDIGKSILNLDNATDYDNENWYIAVGETFSNLTLGRHTTNMIRRGLTSKEDKQNDEEFLKAIKDPILREEIRQIHDSFYTNGFMETMQRFGGNMSTEAKEFFKREIQNNWNDPETRKEVIKEMQRTSEEMATNHYNDVSASYKESLDNLFEEKLITKEEYLKLLEEAENMNIDVINSQYAAFTEDEKRYFEYLKGYKGITDKKDEIRLKLDYMNLLATADKRDLDNIAGAIQNILGSEEEFNNYIEYAKSSKNESQKNETSSNNTDNSSGKIYMLQSIALGEFSIYDINDPKVLGRASLDTWGSASFGILGMNTKTGSFQQFMNKNAGKLGLKTGSRSYYESQEFRSQFAQKAAENPELMKQLQSDYAYDDYLPNKLNGKTTKEFLKSVKNDPAFYNNLAINVLLADGATQTGTIVPNRIKSFARNYNFTTAEKFIKDYTAVNKQHINGDFRSALADQSASYQGLVRRNNVREDASLNVVEFDLE